MFEPRIYESVVTRLKLVSIEDFNKLKDEIERQRALIERAKHLIEVMHVDYMHVPDLDFAAEEWRKDASGEVK